jgi:two-component system sensor histidine kinase VicK
VVFLLKSIQWKLVAMFVMLIFAVMLVFSVFLQDRIEVFYHDSFSKVMNQTMNELEAALQNACQQEDPLDQMQKVLGVYQGRLGISSNRNYYLLDAKTGSVLYGSDVVTSLDKTYNILAAMAGKRGDKVYRRMPYIDYAIRISDDYILYIKDKTIEMQELLRGIYIIVAQALLVGFLISVVLGFFLSRTITRPITNLTSKAENLAKGSFGTKIQIKSQDEIGQLAKAFNYMSEMIKNSVDEIAQEKNKLETMFRYMSDGVIAFGMDQKVIHINPAAREMLGIESEDEILFDSFFECANTDICMNKLILFDQHTTIERRIDIGGRHLKGFFATFEMADDKLSGVIVVLQDITEEQRLEDSRREFVANVSHELRTPLTTIKSYSETLLDSTEDEEQSKFLTVIINEVDRMTRIVKDLLTLSSLDSKKLSTFFTEFSLDELLRDITAKMSMEAKSHNHRLEYYPSTSIPNIFGDRDRIEQVITNILSNSIKYTPDGGRIEVYAGYLYNEAYIKIKDNGIGIKQEDLSRIFERFYRVDKARSRESGGTGLGLAIAKNFIELHGGTIKVDSEIGKGTEVLIKLPVSQNEAS